MNLLLTNACRFRGWMLYRLMLGILTSGFIAMSVQAGTVLDDIKQQNKLIVLTRASSTTYVETAQGAKGFEYDLTQRLAEALNVKVEYKVYDTEQALLSAIAKGEGHIAAAGLTRTEQREEAFNFGPTYQTIRQQVVCRRDAYLPKNVYDLQKVNLLIVGGSSYEERLEELRNRYPGLNWDISEELATEQVLQKISEGYSDCTIADSNIVTINQRYYPQLQVAFSLNKEQELAWVLPQQDKKLESFVDNWFVALTENAELDAINERYYGSLKQIKQSKQVENPEPEFVSLVKQSKRVNNVGFNGLIETRLTNYREHFEAAADKYDLPWALLAAQAYQESGWNPKAVSPSGVKGMMMLTKETAKILKVADRTNPKQSIEGAALYMTNLLNQLSPDIPKSERHFFALAAYNVGIGHLHDARELAKKLGKNPNLWCELRGVFPLLSEKKYSKFLKFGSTSNAVVDYVDRVLAYRVTLEKLLIGKRSRV